MLWVKITFVFMALQPCSQWCFLTSTSSKWNNILYFEGLQDSRASHNVPYIPYRKHMAQTTSKISVPSISGPATSVTTKFPCFWWRDSWDFCPTDPNACYYKVQIHHVHPSLQVSHLEVCNPSTYNRSRDGQVSSSWHPRLEDNLLEGSGSGIPIVLYLYSSTWILPLQEMARAWWWWFRPLILWFHLYSHLQWCSLPASPQGNALILPHYLGSTPDTVALPPTRAFTLPPGDLPNSQ